jgi:hypothetical protein
VRNCVRLRTSAGCCVLWNLLTSWEAISFSRIWALRRFHVNSEERLLALSCFPLRPHVLALLLLDRFSWNLILEACTTICRESPNLVKIGRHHQALYVKSKVRLYSWQQYKIYCSWTTVQTIPILGFSLQHWTLLHCWQPHVGQQLYEGNELFRFYGNSCYTNSSRCCITRTAGILPQSLRRFAWQPWTRVSRILRPCYFSHVIAAAT